MPHLQFETDVELDESEKRAFAAWATDLYGEVMDTGTGHVAVAVRDGASVALGRADPDAPVAFLNVDVRAGRSFEQRRELAVAAMEEIADRWRVPTGNAYVIYTEHPGEDFVLREGALESWSPDEAEATDE